MVRGINIFEKYFGSYPENYIIIGGTACDIRMEEAGFNPRATKDIDLILVVEALNSEFVKHFWKFIQDGNYERQEKSNDDRKYYRFMKPEDKNFPFQIELFSRTPDNIDLEEPAHLTPIPVDDDLSSLSAILMSDDYYNYLREHSSIENKIHLANLEALICLKAKAFLEINERIAAGEKEDTKHLKKHKNDVFKLAAMLPGNSEFELPESIKEHLNEFLVVINNTLPEKIIYKEMGLPTLNSERIINQLIKSFGGEVEHGFLLDVENLKKTQNPPIIKIERSSKNILTVLENVYFPLLRSLKNELKAFDSLFKKTSWSFFEEPIPPDYNIPMLPTSANLNSIIEYFNNIAKKKSHSYHDFKVSYILTEYKDEKQFSLEIALRIYFHKYDYKIKVSIGQPFQSSRISQMVSGVIQAFTKDTEPINGFKQFEFQEQNYDNIIAEDELKKWSKEIRKQTLESIKDKVNNL